VSGILPNQGDVRGRAEVQFLRNH